MTLKNETNLGKNTTVLTVPCEVDRNPAADSFHDDLFGFR